MENEQWLLCPVCKNKTRIRLREDTELQNFPLFCPKCRQKTLINVKHLNTTVIKEPDAQTQGVLQNTPTKKDEVRNRKRVSKPRLFA